jgi:hypothetical protein
MKYIVQFVLLLFFLNSYSQKNPQTSAIKRISAASTVMFTVDNTGCFGGEIITYRMAKQKNGERKVTYQKNGKTESKKISAKNYASFIKNYSGSFQKFRDTIAVKQTCTSVSVFSLYSGRDSLGFKNVTCQPEFNPEFFLMERLK